MTYTQGTLKGNNHKSYVVGLFYIKVKQKYLKGSFRIIIFIRFNSWTFHSQNSLHCIRTSQSGPFDIHLLKVCQVLHKLNLLHLQTHSASVNKNKNKPLDVMVLCKYFIIFHFKHFKHLTCYCFCNWPRPLLLYCKLV